MVLSLDTMEAVGLHILTRSAVPSPIPANGESGASVMNNRRALDCHRAKHREEVTSAATHAMEYCLAVGPYVDEYQALQRRPLAWCPANNGPAANGPRMEELRERIWYITERYAPGVLMPGPNDTAVRAGNLTVRRAAPHAIPHDADDPVRHVQRRHERQPDGRMRGV